ncbi:hypothetical protein [Roseococcus sp. SYP-B2431]|uniref:hypothetical protein n=1 Tax=Roseococcus sp. SYP-B2431 TaxID=2496640 RepID=UPI0013F4B392|nr:hypothetical protein [Roseococcus sp. SYP-B2431]
MPADPGAPGVPAPGPVGPRDPGPALGGATFGVEKPVAERPPGSVEAAPGMEGAGTVGPVVALPGEPGWAPGA